MIEQAQMIKTGRSITYKVKLSILTFFFLASFLAASAQEVLDSLKRHYENTALSNSEKFYTAGRYVQALFFNDQVTEAQQVLQQNIDQAVLFPDGTYAAYLYAIQAMNYRILDDVHASKSSIAQALHFSEKTSNHEIKGYVDYSVGWLQVRDNDEGEAVRSLIRAIHHFDQAPVSGTLDGRKSATYKELASIYANWNNYQLQEKYALLAFELALQQPDPIATFDAYMLMGYMYEQQYAADSTNRHALEQAEKHYIQAIETYTKHQNQIPLPSNLSFVAINLANLYFSFFPDSYQDQALYYAALAKQQGLATQQYTHVASAYGIMAETALQNKQPKQAKEYLLSALNHMTKSSVNDQNILLSIYQNLSEIAEAENDLAEALRYHKAYMQTFSSIFDQKQVELGNRLEAQFEKERQKQQLVNMQLEAEKKEQQINLMQAISRQQQQEFENLKLHEENQKKQLDLTQLESEKHAQELKLAKLETESRAQDILNFKNEISYKEKINKYYISLALVFLLLLILLLYAYKKRSESLRKSRELYQFSMDKQQQNVKIATLTAMLEGQETERGRMARDLHDGLGSLLSSTKIGLSQWANKLDGPYQAAYKNSLGQLDMAVDELRKVAHNLMPDLLDKYGLKEALQDYAARMSNDQVAIHVQLLQDTSTLAKSKQLIIYRIIQELVNNAIKHASATQILIQIAQEADHYMVTVEDDGVGFDIEQIKGNQSAGLHNIQSRIDFLKGQFHIRSEQQIGTSIEMTFPNQ